MKFVSRSSYCSISVFFSCGVYEAFSSSAAEEMGA